MRVKVTLFIDIPLYRGMTATQDFILSKISEIINDDWGDEKPISGTIKKLSLTWEETKVPNKN